MTWECRLIEFEPGMSGKDLSIGDMFYGPTAEQLAANPDGLYWPHFFSQDKRLSDFYRQHNSHRRPLLVWLPGRTLFCVDAKCWSGARLYGGWEVYGEVPRITLSPSINIGGSYHGFIKDGIISPDVEGRVFDQLGYEVKE